MSRDFRLSKESSEFSAYINTSGLFIPKSGDSRIVITDVSSANSRPVFLRQHSTDNVATGIVGRDFLAIPISGNSHFTTPVKSHPGVNIFSSTEEPVAAKYYYFNEYNSVFNTEASIKVQFSMFSDTGFDLTDTTGIIRFNGASPVFAMTGVGSGRFEQIIDPDDYGIDMASAEVDGANYDLEVEVTGAKEVNIDRVMFRGHNAPIDQGSFATPTDDEGGSFKYSVDAVVDGENNIAYYDLYFTDNTTMNNVDPSEILMDIRVFV